MYNLVTKLYSHADWKKTKRRLSINYKLCISNFQTQITHIPSSPTFLDSTKTTLRSNPALTINKQQHLTIHHLATTNCTNFINLAYSKGKYNNVPHCFVTDISTKFIFAYHLKFLSDLLFSSVSKTGII